MKHQTSSKRAADPSWDTNDDKKRKKWKDQEVMAMLNLMKKHNLLEDVPTDAQLGETLLKPLQNLGYSRTSHQIKLKIKSLRKSYVQYRKGNFDALKNSPFYEILESLYSNTEANDSESEDESHEIDDDSMMWSESGLNKLLMIIKQLDLSHELSSGTISQRSLRQIHKFLQNFSIHKSLEQIKLLILNLRNTYANYKKELANGSSEESFPYFEQLDALWKREYANGCFHSADGYDEFWSEEETILLLEGLKDLGIDDIENGIDDIVTSKIEEFLSESGYKRTQFQIMDRINVLKQNYTLAKKCESLDEAIAKFPFYLRYENLFNISSDLRSKNDEYKAEQSDNLEMEDLIVLGEKKKHSRGYIWLEEEVYTLLDLVKKMKLISIFRGRMTLDYVSQLVKPLAACGYIRTGWQIKIKLKGLRNQYYRCVQSNLSPQAMRDCPFFDRIHEMVQMLDEGQEVGAIKWKKPLTSNKRLKTKKKDAVLKEIIVDEHDQSYSNEMDVSTMSENIRLIKKNEMALWEPLETIPDSEEEDNSEINSRQDVLENEEDRLSEMFEEVSDEEAVYEENVYNIINEEDIEIDEESNVEGTEYVHYANMLETEDVDNSSELDGFETFEETKFTTPTMIKVIEDTTNINSEELNSSKDSKDFSQLKDSLKKTPELREDIVAKVLQHEKLLQEQHHVWLEKQFEIQRRHDSQLRLELLNELRQLRCAIMSTRGVLNE